MHNDFGALRYQSIASKLQYAKRYSRTPGATSMHACGKRVPLLNADTPGKPRNMVAELCNDEFCRHGGGHGDSHCDGIARAFFAHCNFTEAIFFVGLVSYTILVSVYIMSGMEITAAPMWAKLDLICACLFLLKLWLFPPLWPGTTSALECGRARCSKR